MFASALQKRKAQAQQPPQARPQQTKEAGSAPQWKRAKQIAEEVHGASAAWSLSEMLSKKQSTAATPTTAATNAEPKDKLSTTRSWSKPSEQQKPATTGGWKKTAATKARAVASKTVGKQQQQGDEQEGVVFELSAKRRVTVRRWRAAVLIDIREYYDDNGVSKPGKKGISLSQDQWTSLQRLSPAIDEAIELVRDDNVDEQSLAEVSERIASDSKERSIAFTLSSKRRITVRFFRAAVLIDLREYYDQDGVAKPGKKGISLSSDQWKSLYSLEQEVSEAASQL